MKKLPAMSACLLGPLESRANANYDVYSKKALDYLIKSGDSSGNTLLPQSIERTTILDSYLKSYLEKTSGPVKILNIGCGLCTRIFRFDDFDVEWTQVDNQEVLDVRKEVFPKLKKDSLIAADLNDWVPNTFFDLTIAEGIFMYLPIKTVRRFMVGRVFFDVWGCNRVDKPSSGNWFYDPKDWVFKIKRKNPIWKVEKDAWVLDVES